MTGHSIANSDVNSDAGGAPVIAGVGFSSKAGAQDILKAVHEALRQQGCSLQRLTALASIVAKRHSEPLKQAAVELQVDLIFVEQDAAMSASSRGITRSHISMDATGLPSVSEAAALAGTLAACGQPGRLLALRLCHGAVTCALAVALVQPSCDQEPPGATESTQS